jgi:hypothetical protein
VNLNEWFVSVAETALVSSLELDEIENTKPVSGLVALYIGPATAAAQHTLQTQLALDFE